MHFTPGLGAAAYKFLAGRRCHPGLVCFLVNRIATAVQVQCQAKEGQVPSDASGTWPKSFPMRFGLFIFEHDVLQGKARSIPVGLKSHRNPAQMFIVFPSDVQGLGWIAAKYFATSVTFELKSTAWSQVAINRQKPAWYPCDVCQRIPQVVDIRGIGTRTLNDSYRLSISCRLANLAKFGAEGIRVIHFDLYANLS